MAACKMYGKCQAARQKACRRAGVTKDKRQKTKGVMAPLAVSAFIFHSASRTTEQVSFGRPATTASGSSFSWNTLAKACFLGVHPGEYETAARMLETDADGPDGMSLPTRCRRLRLTTTRSGSKLSSE